jgi:hypothetical protein
VLLHQDAFAADYQEDEYKLLGMAIKYAGLRGKGSACNLEEPQHFRRRHHPVNAIVRFEGREVVNILAGSEV